jgi:pyrroline-5-carboxylate reductase
LPAIAASVGNDTLVLSIMAGRRLEFLQRFFPAGAALVRAMPNTPAAIGRGITVACPNARVNAAQRRLAGDLLAEAMAKAGVVAGLPADLADRLARETVAGSGELLHRSELEPAALRRNVTSPGGTTAAALEVLMGPDGFDRLLTEAIAAATRRSRELAG